MSFDQPLSRRLAIYGAIGAWLVPTMVRAQPTVAVGQEWSVKSAETTSLRVIIGRIDPGPNGATVVSVSIVDIPPGYGPTAVGHAPFDSRALIGSLDRVVATGVAPAADFQDGYDTWKSAHGGVFTLGVLEALAAVRTMIEQRRPPTQS